MTLAFTDAGGARDRTVSPPPAISIVVASFRAYAVLAETLTVLMAMSRGIDVELVVARDSGLDDVEVIRRSFPGVRVVPSPVGPDVPRLRGAGLTAALGTIVLLTEDHCVPGTDWIVRLSRAVTPHRVAGGGMDNAQTRRGVDWGAYFSEYGFFDRHRQDTENVTPALTGANVGYHRDIVADVAAWMSNGDWENTVHARLRARGLTLHFVPDATAAQNLHYRVAAFCQDRYAHGVDYARTRVDEERWGPVRRVAMAALAPWLAPLLIRRLYKAAAGPGRRLTFLRAAPWTTVFLCAWSAGECVGYLRGSAARSLPT